MVTGVGIVAWVALLMVSAMVLSVLLGVVDGDAAARFPFAVKKNARVAECSLWRRGVRESSRRRPCCCCSIDDDEGAGAAVFRR